MTYKHILSLTGIPTILLRSQLGSELEFLRACEGKTFMVTKLDDHSISFDVVATPASGEETGVPSITAENNYDNMAMPDLSSLAVQRGLNPYLSSDGKNKQLMSKGNVVKLLRMKDQRDAEDRKAG